ncbi:MAG: hypothetical protein ACW99F_16955 [Candidatus Hodarchaeales archaeon]
MHDVVMPTSLKTQALKVCLECYQKMDVKNPRDFGSPHTNKDLGTHTTKKVSPRAHPFGTVLPE